MKSIFLASLLACFSVVAQIPTPEKSSAWKIDFTGAGNIFYNYFSGEDESIKGNHDPLQIRRTYLDVTASRKSANGVVTGARIRFWMEPVFYNGKMHQDGFGADDTRTPLDFMNEIEGYIQNIPLDEGKTNFVSITAGKGYVRFGLDRPEEQAPFSEFPLIHPVTKAGGLGQVMHVRVNYKNTSHGIEVDGEVFEPSTPDTNYFDIDLPQSFGHGQAISFRKNLPLNMVAVGSFANMKFADNSEEQRYAAGGKISRNLTKTIKFQETAEYVYTNRQLVSGQTRNTKAVLSTTQVSGTKNTFAFQYGRILNPARVEPVNQYTAYFGRQLAQKGKLKINGFVEAGNTSGIERSQVSSEKSKRVATGIQFKF